MTAAGMQLTADFHSGKDTGRMIGWKIILLANSGGMEGKLVSFGCSLQELSLIKAMKLSYTMLKPGQVTAELQQKLNKMVAMSTRKNYEFEGRTSFSGNISIKQKPVSRNPEEIIHCNPLACAIKEIRLS